MPEPIGVLVVDDSALMRNVLSKIVETVPGLRLADKAMNGVFALEKIPRCTPDVIVLDLEMPEMNGIEFLKERKRLGLDIPVVILSSLARSGAEITMEALALGASDFITKPSGPVSQDIYNVAHNLASMLIAYGGEYRRRHGKEAPSLSEDAIERIFRAHEGQTAGQAKGLPDAAPALKSAPAATRPEPQKPLRRPGPIEIIAIGISTGGPNALREILPNIDPNLSQPVVVVQHMPAGFTEEFAKSLNRICPLEVKEAKEGDVLKPGRVLIAPGNFHMEVEKRNLSGLVHVNEEPHVNSHRPSVDVLFASVARHYGNHAMGVIMTGMGADGARELGTIYREGGLTLGQDEESSIVYGMPRVAFEQGYVMRQVGLKDMAATISRLAKDPAGD